jgi:Ca2+:H+ antiporter
MNYLFVFVPISILLAHAAKANPLWIFATGVLAIVPLAEWIRKATDQLAERSGPAIGGLLSVTFGNIAELILGLSVLRADQADVVKGQITGAIIGNGLLGLGLTIIVGTWRRGKLTFQRDQAGLLSSLLMIVTIALLTPALFDYTERGINHGADPQGLDRKLSLCVSAVLIAVYIANLTYTMLTARSDFKSVADVSLEEHKEEPTWSLGKALAILIGATLFTTWEAELVSDAVGESAEVLHVTPFFLGVIVLAIVGNVSEYLTAIYFAAEGKMDLSMSITLGSTIQIALLVAPLLVLLSGLVGHPMDLVFANPLELIAIAAVAFTVNAIAHDGEATWFEGVLLLAVYAILGIAFFYVT